MKARVSNWGNRRGSRRFSPRSKTLLVVVVAMVAALAGPAIGAQPVGNPGNLNMKVVGGNIVLGSQQIDLNPKPTFECNDGVNNDGDASGGGDNQDAAIDFPADPQCTAANDNSEVQAGFQAKQDITINGTVTAAGAVNVPQSGVFFPPIYQWAAGAVLTAQVSATAAGTGTINPITGAATLTIPLKFGISGAPQGQDLTSSCQVGPFTLSMRTGTTTPPPPNEPISGIPYNDETGQATVVDNSFSVPGATGCATLGAANGPLSAAFGVPAASGQNTAILVLEASPKITKGVKASNVPSVTTGVSPLTVNFNGTGSTAVKPIASYAWDFGNGETATGSTAFTTYATPGTYQAKLTVTDTDGDKDVSIKTITVNEPPNVVPTAAIGSSGTGGVAPYAVNFDGTGSNDPDGSIVSYAWDFGNDRTATTAVASANYTSPGTYTVTLSVTDNRGAVGTATRVITVTGAPNLPPSAVIRTVSVAGTVPLTVNLSGSNSTDPDGSIATYAWDLGNGATGSGASVQAIYNTIGSYTVTLVVTDDRGAQATTTLVIEVSENFNFPPVADFVADPVTGTAPLSVSFDGTASSDEDGTIASHAWAFGNGQNGAGATPAAVTYSIPGTYTAKLTVTDNRGATGTATQTITVLPPANQTPVANFTPTPTTGSAPLLVQLSSAGSSDADGAITGYAWNFGNGTTSSSPNPSAVFNTAGTFTISLSVTDNSGASAVKSTTIVVNPTNVAPVPVISATPLTGSAPLTVNVNGAGSSDADGSIVSYAWDFGNGQTATGATASTVYSSLGSYTLRLTVTDNRGSVRSTTTTIVAGTTNQRPVAVITALPTSGPAPLVVTLKSTGSNDPDGTITKYSWDLGNGQTLLGSQVQFNYTIPGSYTVVLTVTDNRGATATATETVVVDPPVAVTDRVRFQFTGSVNYTYDGKVNAGTLAVSRDVFGLASVSGSGTFTGAGNSAGTYSVNLSRFLWFNAFIGTIVVNDQQNGVNNVTTSVFFTPMSSPSATSARVTGGWNIDGQPYNFTFNFDDRI